MRRASPDPLFLTEGQIAEKFEIRAAEWRAVAAVLERSGLPRPDPLFGNWRYWPAVSAFLDRRAGVGRAGPLGLDGPENCADDRPDRRSERNIGQKAKAAGLRNEAGNDGAEWRNTCPTLPHARTTEGRAIVAGMVDNGRRKPGWADRVGN
jgi:hypothetical protein